MSKLWALENKWKGKRKFNLAFVRKISWGAQKRTRPRYLGTPRKLGSSGNVERDQLRLGQLKGACSWTKETKIGMSHQPPMVQKKADDLEINTSWKEVWYLGEHRKVDHEGRWLGIFQPDREESAHLEKMTKSEAAKKVGLKRSI